MARPVDPYGGFRFVVEIGSTKVGGFSQVSGLERDTTFEDFREGGVNDFTHKLATVTKYPSLTLRRGIADKTDLWQWHQDVINGNIQRQDISVILRDYGDADRWRWVFQNAYPVKWSGPDLNASNNAVAVEAVEFAHQGMRRE
jgi:phage tail-like protein